MPMAIQTSGVLSSYLASAMRHAKCKKINEKEVFAEIPECPGVWGSGATRIEAKRELREVLEEWIVLQLREGETLPIIDGKTLGDAEWH